MSQHDRRRRGRRAARPAALLDAGAALMRAGDEESLLRMLVHTARDLGEAIFAAVLVRPLPQEHEEEGPPASAEGARVHLAVAVGLAQEQEASLRHILLNRHELLSPLWQGGELVRVPATIELALLEEEPATSAGKVPIAQRAQEQQLVPALLAVPLLASDGQIHGGLLVGLHGFDQVSRQDEAMLLSLTSMAALALEKGRFIWQAEEQIQQLQAVLDQLAEGIFQLDAIFEAVPEALVVYDRQGRTMRMNAAGQQLYARLRLSDTADAPFAERVSHTAIGDAQG
jgi:PAS domain-containing protein